MYIIDGLLPGGAECSLIDMVPPLMFYVVPCGGEPRGVRERSVC
jgi:hypothetical protein